MTQVCLSIAPATGEQAWEMIRSEGRSADLIEVRIDTMHPPDLRRLLRQPRPPMIITNRSVQEGGWFRGTAAEHLELMKEAITTGAEYIDTEARWGKRMMRQLLSIKGSTRIILSLHNTLRTPDGLEGEYRAMKRQRPYCIKIAVHARSLTDVGRMIDLTGMAHRRRDRFIGISMGELGEITRIGAGLFGSFLTYASPRERTPTGSGQLNIEEMKSIYRAHKANRLTSLFGLIGNPVRHSPGYLFHNMIFRRKCIRAVYVRIPVEDLDEFMEVLAHRFKGFSVTMPWKEDILPYMDAVTGIAGRIGMVNTVVRKRGRWHGYNTDYPAIRTCITGRVSLKNAPVVVWGTGATAATMAAVAADTGARVTIAGRRTSEAIRLSRRFGCEWVSMEDLRSLRPRIVMNATPIGMENGDMIPRSIQSLLRRGTIVFDAVYSGEPTPLVRLAMRNHCPVIDGWEFFKRQALLQSRIFCGTVS